MPVFEIIIAVALFWFGSISAVIVAFYMGVKSQSGFDKPVELSLEEPEAEKPVVQEEGFEWQVS